MAYSSSRCSSDGGLNYSLTESGAGPRSNGRVPGATRGAYGEMNRHNGYSRSVDYSEYSYDCNYNMKNGFSPPKQYETSHGDYTFSKTTERSRHQEQYQYQTQSRIPTNEELWKRKTASLPRSSKGKHSHRNAISTPSGMDVNNCSLMEVDRHHYRGESNGDRYRNTGNYDEGYYQNHRAATVTRAASFQVGCDDYDYAYRSPLSSQSNYLRPQTSSRSLGEGMDHRTISDPKRSRTPVTDDRYRGYGTSPRSSSSHPKSPSSVSNASVNSPPSQRATERRPDQSLNSSFASSVGSPGKSKKPSRRPSFKAFGSLIQKMVRQIGSMEDTKPPSPSVEAVDGIGGSVIVNGDAEQLPPKSPPYSPILLRGRVPGLSGLRNHGNTCYMNAIVQCLSNTDLLAEYFVLERYRTDLSHSKKLSKKFGAITKGEVTEQLAVLLRAIWSCKYSPHHSTEFKRTVAKHGSQFRGNEQHDAQEFLIWLLDRVHEDLNSAAKKKYKQLKNGQNKSDEARADESLANHMRRNNSFVQKLFQAQYCSSLTCPHCGKQSNTFDPFLCVSLPIPQRTTRVITVVVIYADREPRAVRFGIVIETSGSIADLRSGIASSCGLAVTRIVLTEVYFDGFYRSFGDTQPLADIHDGDSIYAVETPHNPHSMLQSSQVKPYLYVHCNRPTEVITMVIINQQGLGRSGKRFGLPMVVEVDRNVSHSQLVLVILRAMGCAHIDKVMQMGGVMQLGIVIDAKGSRHYVPSEEARPLHTATIYRMLQSTAEEGGPPHIKAIVEWEHDLKFTFAQRSLSIYIEEHESVQRERSSHQQPVRATLFDCIDTYTQKEKLGEDNAWHCSHCKLLQQGTKKLTLWSLPEVLILHLKRFKQVGVTRTKLSTQVEFPIHNLNMGQYIEHRRQSLGLTSNSTQFAHSTLSSDYVYDLYAVCNHSGSLSGGHYTAYCRNSLDGQWYHFDDAKVTTVPEEKIVNKGAYILFYRRRTKMASSTSTNGSMSSTASTDHWVHRMPAFARQLSNMSSGQDSVFSSGCSSQEGGSPMAESPPPAHTWSQSHAPQHNSTPMDHQHAPVDQHTRSSSSSRTDLPEWYSHNGVDATTMDGRASSARSSGRLTPGQRSWHGSRDYVDDDESCGFSAHSRPYVRSVAGSGTLRSPTNHRGWDHESDNDSVLTESCV